MRFGLSLNIKIWTVIHTSSITIFIINFRDQRRKVINIFSVEGLFLGT